MKFPIVIHNLQIIKNIRSDSGNGLPFTNAPPSWLTPECPKSGWKWSSENSKEKKIPKLICEFVRCVEFTFILVEWIFRSMFHFYFALVHLLSLGTGRDDDGIGYIMNHLSVYVCNGFFICSFGRKIMWKYFSLSLRSCFWSTVSVLDIAVHDL